ncbi:glycosyltransferase family 4 protein [Bacteroides thetaiotaomicron]|uniref:glycosyltransferase family 4 protein n=1 Tax=Bacteroides thetaiotaomicron TaxID=818 RepID=UPI001C38883B|nr:glycosyltransferase family 4 protein [Bacteroides thetaiotaomicron]MBV4312194.1 glycosyltransferase family 4 protein [Bacteroides thetaiotaomicron]MBV4331043.1 glycosyltransferase family 4 protein [Bacteroides thetaiotaomicron]MCB7385562.1 glycosyltransferase family 4 protein [Bacteroides thetaiotaomicron]MCG4885065.1 glycosyltransferase family 4 protein [Bacteroides thetaiotaomicron]MCQ5251524.1 glycosyltransferase family 4 protein [Bacteroides thetaiotaomicron]
MNILHVTNSLSEGGVESFLFDLCYYTIRDGHQLSILVLNGDKVGMKKQFEQIGVRVISGRFHYQYNPGNILEIRKYLSSYTLVHVHLFPTQLYVALAYILLPLEKRPIIVTTEHNTYNNRRKYFCLRFLDRFFYRKYAKIICISKQAEINLKKWLGNKFPQDLIITVANGINITRFANALSTLDKIVPVDETRDYLVMVGRFEKQKDQLTLIRALKFCSPNVHLILIGTGPTMQFCKEEVSLLNLSLRVHFVGYSNNVAGLLKGCKIGVLSTHWDGFGLAAVEYMAAGIPVLASDVEGLRDVVGRNDLLFESGNARDLSVKINELLSSDDYYQEINDYLMKNAEKYSAERMAKDYKQIYVSISSN